MPNKPLRPCNKPGCPALTKDGYCEEHKHLANERDKHRGSARQRGYDSTWERLRRMYLREHPLCEDCLDQGKVEPATEVHHKKKVKNCPELRLVWDNLRALSKECHSTRTARGE
jgi:5-methylcytosine-specific restriction enzyme A